MKIQDIKALQILDSRGNPTLKVSVKSEDNWGSFCVPSGASTGTFEALELRDNTKAFNGLAVTKAIGHVETTVKEALIGQDPTKQAEIDQIMIELDGTANKSKLGANAILGVSGAVARVSAINMNLPLYRYLADIFGSKKLVLPKMYFNILNGGKHADNNLDIQETMIVPMKETVAENLQIASEVYHKLKKVIESMGLSTGLGDEGGFAPNLESNTKSIEFILEAITEAGYKPGKDVSLALDVAASELYDPDAEDHYFLASENVKLSAMQLVSLYRDLADNYPIISIEDGLAEEDWEGWQMMTERIGKKVQLIGDDIFVTNVERIKKGIDLGVANSVLIKLNQIGTLTETFEAIKLAKKNNYQVMISHRSGETEDSFIADLSVATDARQIKSGAPARSERTAKYNRLREIEHDINK